MLASLYFDWFWYTGKAKRLKQAKEEAQQEIELYKQECEENYKKIEEQVVIAIY